MAPRAVLTLIFLGLTMGIARAGATPAEKCAASKTAAAGANVDGSAKCYATSLKKGSPVDPGCLGKAEAKLDAAFAKAEKSGGCAVTGDLGAVKGSVSNLCVASFTGAITGDPKCSPLKMKAVGKKTADQATCTKKAILKATPVDPACLGKADASFEKAIETADGKGTCTGTAAALDTASAQCGNAIVAPVTPTPVPTATPTPTPTPGATGTPTPIPTPPPHSCPVFASSDECLGTLGSGSSLATCFNVCVNSVCVVPCGETCPDPVACAECLNANGRCADYCCP